MATPQNSVVNFKAGKYFTTPGYLQCMKDTFDTISNIKGVGQRFDLICWILLGEPNAKSLAIEKKNLNAWECKEEMTQFAAMMDVMTPHLKEDVIDDFKRND